MTSTSSLKRLQLSTNWSDRRGGREIVDYNLHSLLDVSKLTTDTAKVQLTTQYRVPRDIATLLSTSIYNNQYTTAETAKVPKQGFNFIDVPFMESKRRGYVNDNEVQEVVQLVHRCILDEKESIMILTPVFFYHLLGHVFAMWFLKLMCMFNSFLVQESAARDSVSTQTSLSTHEGDHRQIPCVNH
jgi:hypothetical protein